MALTRDEALETLGLRASPDADASAVQQSFERLARRYPQASFPDRFRRLLEARDQLLNAGRAWRGQLEASTLDLAWLVPHLSAAEPDPPATSREALQDMLRAGYLAEPLALRDWWLP
jgi:hypothetical protein